MTAFRFRPAVAGSLLALSLTLALGSCSEGPVAPADPSLVGAWSLHNAQVWGLVAGGVVFRADGSFTITGSEGDAEGGFRERTISGAWARTGDTVELTAGEGPATLWRIDPGDLDEILFLELGGGARWFGIFRPRPD